MLYVVPSKPVVGFTIIHWIQRSSPSWDNWVPQSLSSAGFGQYPSIQVNFRFYHPLQTPNAPVEYYFANWGRGDSDATNGEDRSFYAQSVMTSGTLDINQIPAHSQDAVFTTVQDEGVQQTWALQDQTVQLTLDGLFTWQWNVDFSEPLLPFRLDGSWGVF